MNLDGYAQHDALGLTELVRSGETAPPDCAFSLRAVALRRGSQDVAIIASHPMLRLRYFQLSQLA